MEIPKDINEFDPNSIPRCELCNLIPLININYEQNIPMISYECQNKHKNTLNLSEYLKVNKKNSIFKEKYNECKETNDNSYFCSKCNKFLCKECSNKHSDKNNHMLIQNDRFDSICNLHGNTFSSYCINCKSNLCVYCINKHIQHKIINLSNIIPSEVEKKELFVKLNELKNLIDKIEEVKNNIIKELDKLKENNSIEIKFILELLGTFEYENKKNNINFNVIQNLKNFQIEFNRNKFNLVNNILDKSLCYIDFLKNAKNSKELNIIKCQKVLNSHTGLVYHIGILQDGRFASCSQDKKLIIYNSKTFEPQIEINNLHSDQIFSFTQLHDGKIITEKVFV